MPYNGLNRGASQSKNRLGERAMLAEKMEAIFRKYPRLARYGFEVDYGPPERNIGGGYLEFFAPDEEMSPRPGVPYIEIYDRKLTGDDLERAIYGDMLHHLPSVDPEFRRMREEFIGTLTPQQKAIDRRAYERMKMRGEKRSFRDWFDISRKDAYLRGYLAPDARDEWAGAYTPEQRRRLETMREYLGR